MIKEVFFDRTHAVIYKAAYSSGSLYTWGNGRMDTFEIVENFPKGYIVWNIGRYNFPFPGYIPLAKKQGSFHVDLSTLKAIKCKDEATALRIIKEAGKRTVFRTTFNKLINQ